MRYRYPRKSPYLTVNKVERDRYRISHYYTGSTLYVNKAGRVFLHLCDGRHDPYQIIPEISKHDVNTFLKDMEQAGFLFKGPELESDDDGNAMMALIFPDIVFEKPSMRVIAKIFNLMLSISFIPVLILGLYFALGESSLTSPNHFSMIMGIVIGLIIGSIVHEASHALAATCHNIRVFSIGVGVMHYVIPFAFVNFMDENLKNRFAKADLYGAGPKASLLVGGLALCLIHSNMLDPVFLKAFGFINIFDALFNLVLIDIGLDGANIVQTLIGKDNFFKRVKEITRNKKARQKILRLKGPAPVVFSYMISIMGWPMLACLVVLQALCFKYIVMG